MRTPVVFRVGQQEGEVFALFPTLPADDPGSLCEAYESIGQHGAAHYSHCIQSSRPATPDEYAPLAAELERIGYSLQIVKRASPTMHHQRKTYFEDCNERST